MATDDIGTEITPALTLDIDPDTPGGYAVWINLGRLPKTTAQMGRLLASIATFIARSVADECSQDDGGGAVRWEDLLDSFVAAQVVALAAPQLLGEHIDAIPDAVGEA